MRDIYWPDIPKETKKKISEAAHKAAKGRVKKGDKIQATMCAGLKRWFIFDHWEGYWMRSAGLVDDCSPLHVYKINGVEVDFVDYSLLENSQ